jgi:hypothetical protein
MAGESVSDPTETRIDGGAGRAGVQRPSRRVAAPAAVQVSGLRMRFGSIVAVDDFVALRE